ncbi:MAG: tetratricopeptide repeat protein [Odoribacter sp.]|nr:tetratricopeptide repeat protein [Odoribacter sp.]
MWVACCCDGPGKDERERNRQVMNRVEQLTESTPDSALQLLYTIDESTLGKRKERARFSLLHSILLDKNYFDLTTDSIIRPAMEYYSRNGKREDRAKMYYYLGRIYENAKRTKDAVKAFIQAEQLAGEEEYYFKGLIYGGMGRLYKSQDSSEEALKMFAQASEAFRKSGHQRNLSFSLQQEGDILSDLGKKELSNQKLYEALDMSKQLKDTVNILGISRIIAANFIFYYNDIPQARNFLTDIYTKYHIKEIPQSDYILWGYTYLQEKDLAKAEYYFQQKKLSHPSLRSLMDVNSLWQKLYEEKGEYRKALDYAKQAAELRDSVYEKEKAELVQNLERQYRTELLRIENERLTAKNYYLWTIFLSFFCILAFLFIYICVRIKQKEKEKTEKIRLLQQMLASWIDFLKILGDMAVRTKQKPERFLETFKENLCLKSGHKHFFSDLQAWVNQAFYGIVDYLRKTYPHLTEDDLNFCCLLYLKMPVEVMLLMYDFTNKNSLYNKRSDLRKKMGLSPDEDLDEFLEKLIQTLPH